MQTNAQAQTSAPPPRTTVDPKSIASPGAILMTYRGSVSHGTYVPPENPDSVDDVDFIGVVIAPEAHYIGLSPWGSKGTREAFHGNVDLVEYELRKFVGLLMRCNPNLLSALWGKSEHIVAIEPAGIMLLERRDLFLSKVVYPAFTGYAHAQLKKMTALAFQGYMGEKRKELVKKYGFDTKNAAHCIRIFRMGCELLETGQVNVDRTDIDAEELLKIKRGEWSIDSVTREARILEERAREAVRKTSLPDEPNKKAIEDMLIGLISMELGWYE